MQMAKTKKLNHKWFLVGLLGVIVAAPNATFIKYATGDVSPTVFVGLRFSAVAIFSTPFLLAGLRKFNRQNVKYALLGGSFMTVAVMTYITAIAMSTASYVSIITLLTPIIFVFYAMKMTHEKLTKRSVAGISLAAAGAMTIVVLPIAVKSGAEFVFYPLATLIILLNCLTFPAAIINYRRANEAGMPMGAVISIGAWVTLLTDLVLLFVRGESLSGVGSNVMWAALYSGIIVVFVSKVLGVISYEHIGAAVTSALSYVETILAVLIPVFVLHEHLSVEVVIGGILILLGVYIVEHHKSPHHRHYHMLRHH